MPPLPSAPLPASPAPPDAPSPAPARASSSTPAPRAKSEAPPSPAPAPAFPHEASVPPEEPAPPAAPADSPDADAAVDVAGAIDMETFTQILDLDEDGNHEFSEGMVTAYFTQASATFDEMDAACAGKDLPKLSSLGHFLKGSSAALGVAKVQASCEQIQHYGQKRDEQAGEDLSADAALLKIQKTLVRVKKEYAVAETWLKDWYQEHAGEGEPGT
ncbi:histidine-phosphotransfer domain, HPT domain-containing protein [Dentipellis sp. KUC8613]|nr:histidine-phosphotransfer domain, HPT domain-containing protein [Dentipellis sp. KUC8613]